MLDLVLELFDEIDGFGFSRFGTLKISMKLFTENVYKSQVVSALSLGPLNSEIGSKCD